MTNLDRLRELTETLPTFPGEVLRQNHCKEYEMEKGICLGWYLYVRNNEIGVHRWYSPKGTIFPKHAHGEDEWIFVYRGHLNLKLVSGDIRLINREFYYIPPDTAHGATFPEDTYYLTITIPPAKEFPNAA